MKLCTRWSRSSHRAPTSCSKRFTPAPGSRISILLWQNSRLRSDVGTRRSLHPNNVRRLHDDFLTQWKHAAGNLDPVVFLELPGRGPEDPDLNAQRVRRAARNDEAR